jgi:hypothetical protein
MAGMGPFFFSGIVDLADFNDEAPCPRIEELSLLHIALCQCAQR